MSDPIKPTDADIETLRRAMVEAWQTERAIADLGASDERVEAREHAHAAYAAYIAAKRARGVL